MLLKQYDFFFINLNVCSLEYMAIAESGTFGLVNQVNHTSWVAVDSPTDRRSTTVVWSNFLEEFLCCRFLSFFFLNFLSICGLFHMTESDLFRFLLLISILWIKVSSWFRRVQWKIIILLFLIIFILPVIFCLLLLICSLWKMMVIYENTEKWKKMFITRLHMYN